ncbi:hypothetical protein P7K49_002540 [Saguinus oedipus]|uniref:Uncharacterized protein n=1 Tax=Saguinus oedipus TaxID=9490 RepID=A0ABQ9WHM7_SAGOE|nr:hypothetical protein P7K49_002540 [Saguinus oedipus]
MMHSAATASTSSTPCRGPPISVLPAYNTPTLGIQFRAGNLPDPHLKLGKEREHSASKEALTPSGPHSAYDMTHPVDLIENSCWG